MKQNNFLLRGAHQGPPTSSLMRAIYHQQKQAVVRIPSRTREICHLYPD
jgi:hypothetical protein